MSAPNGNGKLLYWILGALLTVALATGGFLVQRLVAHNTVLHQLDVDIARLQETFAYVTPVVYAVQKEQQDRLQRFADMHERLLLMDQRLTGFAHRLDGQSKRILSLAERLDRLSMGPTIPPPVSGFPP